MKFSSRERFLIGVVMLAAIWAVAFLGFIIPGRNEFRRTEELLSSLEKESNAAQLYLDHYGELEKRLDAMEQTDSAEDFLFRGMDDAFMDRTLQNMAAETGVTIRRMAIGTPSAMELPDEGGEEAASQDMIMENVITMEIESPDEKGVMELADELRRENRSLSLSYLDVESDYDTDSGGQETSGGMRGIMEVRYYYGEIR